MAGVKKACGIISPPSTVLPHRIHVGKKKAENEIKFSAKHKRRLLNLERLFDNKHLADDRR